jgi:hypothetical protein
MDIFGKAGQIKLRPAANANRGESELKVLMLNVSKLKIVVRGMLTAMTITSAAVAQQDTDSASILLPYCKLPPAQTGNNAFLTGRCIGLVQGIADTLALVKQANSGARLTPLCINRPKGANTDQAVKVVVKYGDAHPEQTHAPFSVVATLALTEAWACPN